MLTRLRPGTVIVPWDFSKDSETELETALALANDPSMIRVVHVGPSDASDVAMDVERTSTQFDREMSLKFQMQLRDNHKCRDVMFYVVHGGVAHEIARFAQQYQAGLIVMGTRAHWAFTRFLRGSITSEVIHLARCPVLVLKGHEVEGGRPLRIPSDRAE